MGSSNWHIAPSKAALVEQTDDGSTTWVPTADELTPWHATSDLGPDPITTEELLARLDGVSDAAQEVVEGVREETVERFTERTDAAAASVGDRNYEEARSELAQATNDHLALLEALDRIAAELA